MAKEVNQMEQTTVNITDLLREQSQISSRIHHLEIQIWNLREEIQNLQNREGEIEEALNALGD
jgi:chromosome segregation ATPase